MGRSDYSTEVSTVDESTYASEGPHESNSQSYEDVRRGHSSHAHSGHGGHGGHSTHHTSSSNKHSSSNNNVGISGLNRRLRTEFIDVDPTDESFSASLTRGIVGLVGACFTPRQILVALRLLKAITVCFIVLTAAADVVYISMVEFVADSYQIQYFGVRRDTILRIYGFALSVLALMIELDKFVMKNFKVWKGFLARFTLLFFIATVTYCHPAQHNYGYNNNGGTGVPPSAVIFQMVASSVLAICSFMYLLFGLLCFDRFTSRAFLSTQDPVASTAIPSGHNNYESPNLG